MIIVSERYTTSTCSNRRALTGPKGVSMLNVRIWVCGECSVAHDRDVNAAKNIRFAARCSPSVSGDEWCVLHRAAEPGISPARGTAPRAEAGGMHTGDIMLRRPCSATTRADTALTIMRCGTRQHGGARQGVVSRKAARTDARASS